MDETRERGCIRIVSLRKSRPVPPTAIPYGSDEWKRLYRLHADLTMLARLGQALSRVRAVPLAA